MSEKPRAAAAGGSASRKNVVQLVFRDKEALYAAYMPALRHGGLFMPTTRTLEYRLGDEVYLLVTLPDDSQRYSVVGRAAWITPAKASGGRTQGVGVGFADDQRSQEIRLRIEQILGTAIASSRPTQTL